MSQQHKQVIGPWTALLLGVIAFVVIYAGVQALRVQIFSRIATHDPREIVDLRAFTSIVLIWLTLGAIVLITRMRGQRLPTLGWLAPSSVLGWTVAAVVVVIYCAITIAGTPIKSAPFWTDWSGFRVGTALAVGISAGICEETIFRGFVMTQARDGGLHPIFQVILSAVLFGLAHIGWGGLTGHFQWGPALGSMIATLLLGAMLAVAYLAARRSLMPVIVAHAVIDMVIEPWLLLSMVTGAGFVHG